MFLTLQGSRPLQLSRNLQALRVRVAAAAAWGSYREGEQPLGRRRHLPSMIGIHSYCSIIFRSQKFVLDIFVYNILNIISSTFKYAPYIRCIS